MYLDRAFAQRIGSAKDESKSVWSVKVDLRATTHRHLAAMSC